jgi:hypothetical protein
MDKKASKSVNRKRKHHELEHTEPSEFNTTTKILLLPTGPVKIKTPVRTNNFLTVKKAKHESAMKSTQVRAVSAYKPRKVISDKLKICKKFKKALEEPKTCDKFTSIMTYSNMLRSAILVSKSK